MSEGRGAAETALRACLCGEALKRDALLELLAVPPASDAALSLRRAAHKAALALCGGRAWLWGALGLDYALTAMFLALLVPQCVSRLHVLVALFTTVLSIALKAAGMSQWNVAVATVLGASLGVLLLYARRGPGLNAPGGGSDSGETRPAQPATSEVRP